jgi:hypothetical protein
MNSVEYWGKLKTRLAPFVAGGGKIQCVRMFRTKMPQTCELCDKHPIHRNCIIENESTGQRLRVGCECVKNYEVALREMGIAAPLVIDKNIQDIAHAWLHDKRCEGNKLEPWVTPEEEHREQMKRVWGDEYEEDEDEDIGDGASDEDDVDDAPPEGLGGEDVDWDSHG